MADRIYMISFAQNNNMPDIIKQVELSEFLFIKHYLRGRWLPFVIHKFNEITMLHIYFFIVTPILLELYNRPHHIGAGRTLQQLQKENELCTLKQSSKPFRV